ncbi:MAG: RiPP maturation radical SAM C-methyltransferase [Candidatus Eremiobacterota bacterium]
MKIDFVVSPFEDIKHPLVGVSSLKSVIKREGHRSSVHYMNIPFAESLGPYLYQWLSADFSNSLCYIGDFLFSLLRCPGMIEERINSYVNDIVSYYIHDDRNVRLIYEQFIKSSLPIIEKESNRAVDAILSSEPDITGFTVGTRQMGGALYLSKLLKNKNSDMQIWFGGPWCTGPDMAKAIMKISCADAVFTGESEICILKAIEEIEKGNELNNIPGIITHVTENESETAPLPKNLDDLPVMDVTDYFTQIRNSNIYDRISPILFMETARGCWWGEKHRCFFCGIDPGSICYRAKSPQRAFEEIKSLVSAWEIKKIRIVDNIMSPLYYDSLLPAIKEASPGYDIILEIKANARKEQIKSLKEAGIKMVQTGIEALNDELLLLLNKGCNLFQNLCIMKWCEEFSLVLAYNHLFGIPGEKKEFYREIIELIPHICHLRPPMMAGTVRLDRFSTFREKSEAFGINIDKPFPRSFSYCFPEKDADLMSLAYEFTFSFLPPGSDNWKIWFELDDMIKKWRYNYYGAVKKLAGSIYEDHIKVEDNRYGETAEIFIFEGEEKFLIEHSDRPVLIKSLINKGIKRGFSEKSLMSAIDKLTACHIILRKADKILSVVVFMAEEEDMTYRISHRDKKQKIILNDFEKKWEWLILNAEKLSASRFRWRIEHYENRNFRL